MAKRRPLPSPPPAPVESSDDEAFSSAEEEDEKNITPIKPNPNPRKDEDEDEDEDEEETQEPVEPEEEEEEELEEEEESDDEDLPPAAAAADDEKIPDPVSESGSEPDSDSDSDEPPKAVKPISSKPMPPNPVAASPLSPRKPRDDGGTPFQRVWSLTDEIALLRGVLNYKANTGTIPHNISQKLGRFADFPDLVRGSLKMDASEGQLSEKIRRLKTKYEKAAARSSPHFASAHDREAFELSAQIWGNSGAIEENVVMENGGEGDPAGYRFLREAVAARKDFGAAAALEALERIDSGKARALEEKFKKQKMASLKLHVQRMDLQKETFKAIMDGVDRSG